MLFDSVSATLFSRMSVCGPLSSPPRQKPRVSLGGSMAAPTSSQDKSKSHPYFTQKVRLHSFHAQQVFDRGYEQYANAIFSLSVVLRIVGSDEQAREVEGIVDEQMNKMFEDIRGEVARLASLAEANGIEFNGIEYSNPKEIEAKISSPRAVRYVGLIREFDGMVAKLDTLWLSGVIPDGDYSRGIFGWKRRLLRLAGSARSISARAMVAARKKGISVDETAEVATKAETIETPTANTT